MADIDYFIISHEKNTSMNTSRRRRSFCGISCNADLSTRLAHDYERKKTSSKSTSQPTNERRKRRGFYRPKLLIHLRGHTGILLKDRSRNNGHDTSFTLVSRRPVPQRKCKKCECVPRSSTFADGLLGILWCEPEGLPGILTLSIEATDNRFKLTWFCLYVS